MTKHNDQERAMFESAAKKHRVEGIGFNLEKVSSGSYVDNETRMLWEGWKLARAQLPAGGAVSYGWVAAGRFFTDRSAAIEAAEKTPCIEVYSRTQLLADAQHPVSDEQKPANDIDKIVKGAIALLDLDARNALAPHGIGGLAREVISQFIAAHRAQSNAYPELAGLQAAYDLLLADGQGPMQTRVIFDRLAELRKEAGLAPLAPPVPGPSL